MPDAKIAVLAQNGSDGNGSAAREGIQARERELAACSKIIDAHLAALVERLSNETRRLATAFEHACEIC